MSMAIVQPHLDTCRHPGGCGCYISDCCLDCPLAECILVEADLARSILFAGRDKDIATKVISGVPVSIVASQNKISERTVRRITGNYRRRRQVNLTDPIQYDTIERRVEDATYR